MNPNEQTQKVKNKKTFPAACSCRSGTENLIVQPQQISQQFSQSFSQSFSQQFSQQNRPSNFKGYTLIEILLVLALLIVLFGLLWGLVQVFSDSYVAGERRATRSQLVRSIAQLLSADLGAAVQDPIHPMRETAPGAEYIRRFGLRGDSTSLQIDVIQINPFAKTASFDENRSAANGSETENLGSSLLGSSDSENETAANSETEPGKQVPELKTIFYEFIPINKQIEEKTSENEETQGDSAEEGAEDLGSEMVGSLSNPTGETGDGLFDVDVGLGGGSSETANNLNSSLDSLDGLFTEPAENIPRFVKKFGFFRKELDYETPSTAKESASENNLGSELVGSLDSFSDISVGNVGDFSNLDALQNGQTSNLIGTDAGLLGTDDSLTIPTEEIELDEEGFPIDFYPTAAQIAMNSDDGVMWAPEVVDCRFRYFDGVNWLDSWDSIEKNGLPVAIEVSLKLMILEDVETLRKSPLILELEDLSKSWLKEAAAESASETTENLGSEMVGSLLANPANGTGNLQNGNSVLLPTSSGTAANISTTNGLTADNTMSGNSVLNDPYLNGTGLSGTGLNGTILGETAQNGVLGSSNLTGYEDPAVLVTTGGAFSANIPHPADPFGNPSSFGNLRSNVALMNNRSVPITTAETVDPAAGLTVDGGSELVGSLGGGILSASESGSSGLLGDLGNTDNSIYSGSDLISGSLDNTNPLSGGGINTVSGIFEGNGTSADSIFSSTSDFSDGTLENSANILGTDAVVAEEEGIGRPLDLIIAELGLSPPMVRQVVTYLPTTPLSAHQKLERKVPTETTETDLTLSGTSAGGNSAASTILSNSAYTNRNRAGAAGATGERDFSQRDFSQRDFSQQDFAQRDFSARDFSQQDFSQRDFSQRNFAQRDFSASGTGAETGARNFAQRDFSQRNFAQRDFSAQDFTGGNRSGNQTTATTLANQSSLIGGLNNQNQTGNNSQNTAQNGIGTQNGVNSGQQANNAFANSQNQMNNSFANQTNNQANNQRNNQAINQTAQNQNGRQTRTTVSSSTGRPVQTSSSAAAKKSTAAKQTWIRGG